MRKVLSLLLFVLFWVAVLGGLAVHAWWCWTSSGWMLWLPIPVFLALIIITKKRKFNEEIQCFWLNILLLFVIGGAGAAYHYRSWNYLAITICLGVVLIWVWLTGAFRYSNWLGVVLSWIPWFGQYAACQAAINSTDEELQITSAKRLINQKYMTDFALYARYARCNDVIQEVITRLNQLSLTIIAKKCEYSTTRLAAIKRLNDQDIIMYVAINDEDRFVRIVALELLQEQSLLEDVAKKCKHTDVLLKTAGKLDNVKLAQSVYAYVAIKGGYDEKNTAIGLIGDRFVLADVAKNSENEKIKTAAVNRLCEMVLVSLKSKDVSKIQSNKQS